MTVDDFFAWASLDEAKQVVGLLPFLQGMDDATRAELTRHYPSVAKRIRADRWRSEDHTLLAAHLDVTPTAVVRTMDAWGLHTLGRRTADVAEALARRGREWVATFVTTMTARRGLAENGAPLVGLLVDRFDLPLPGEGPHWWGWMALRPLPAPGQRWLERFRLACATPDTFLRCHHTPENLLHMLPTRLEELRAVEPVTDADLLEPLLAVFERGDRPQAQRNALVWLEGLGLIPRLRDHLPRVIAAIPTAGSGFVKLILDHVVAEVPDHHRADLAAALLTRSEKGLRARAAKLLPECAEPPAEPPPPPVTEWPVPGPFTPEPSARFTDPDESQDDLHLVEALTPDPEDPERREWFLTLATRIAHRDGVDHLRSLLAVQSDLLQGVRPPVRDELTRFLAGKRPRLLQPATPEGGGLHLLSDQRSRQIIRAFGTVPCVLSAASHAGFTLTWEEFARRVAQYRALGVAARPADVAVALGRLDRARCPDDLSPYALPIQGRFRRLHTVLATWRDATVPEATVRLGEQQHRHEYLTERIEVTGDEVPGLSLLGLDAHWATPYRADRWFGYQGDVSALTLMPWYCSRPCIHVLRTHSPATTMWPLAPLLRVARRFSPVLSFTVLAATSTVPATHRDEIAGLLLTAWEQGRLSGDELAAGWRPDWQEVAPLQPARIVALLDTLTAAGAAPLAWPLLGLVTEHLAATHPTPAATTKALALLGTVLPAARAAGHPVSLPHTQALAAHTGSGQAVRAARALSL